MKIEAFLFILLAAYGKFETLSEFKNRIMDFHGQCDSEIDPPDSDYNLMANHQSPATEKGKCYLACMHKKMGVQTADGALSKEGSLAEVATRKGLIESSIFEKFVKTVDVCLEKPLTVDNECETAVNIMKCIHTEGEALGLSPGEARVQFD